MLVFNDWYYFYAFQTYFMFKIRRKVGCSLLYLSAQLKKSRLLYSKMSYF